MATMTQGQPIATKQDSNSSKGHGHGQEKKGAARDEKREKEN